AQDRAEGTTGTGNQQNRRRREDALGHPVLQFLPFVVGLEQGAGQTQADRQGNYRLAQEGEQGMDHSLTHRASRQVDHRAQADQRNRHEDGSERPGRSRQNTVAVAHGLIGVAIDDRRAIFDEFDFLVNKAIGPEHAGQGSYQGYQQADTDHQPEVGFQPQVARRGNRAGGRWHKGMGGIQAGGQGYAHCHNRYLHARGQGILQRVENDVARITEHRNGDQVADNGHGQGGEALTEQADHRFSHGDGRAAALEDDSDDGSEDDDDTDVTEDIAEAPGDVAGDFQGRQLVGKTRQQGRTEQSQKGMQLPACGRHDDKDNQCDQYQDQTHYRISYSNVR